MTVLTTRKHHLAPKLKVVVAGGASGIGKAQAQLFLAQGHDVLVVDCQSATWWLTAQQQYSQAFASIIGDISEQSTSEKVLQWINTHWQAVDVLCNTAGILDDFTTLEDLTFEQWQRILSVNVTGMMLMTQTLLPLLLQQPAARVINMASIASLTAGGGGIAYTTAKHAVAGFTKQLAYDYAQTGLRVNAIAPGAIQTAMTASDFAGEAEMAQWVAEQVPTKRWAQAEEVAQLTLFLASDAADYMQGNLIPLDGGWLIR